MASTEWQPAKSDGSTIRASSSHGHDNVTGKSTSPLPSARAVSFPDERISPLIMSKNKELEQKDYLDLDKSARQYSASLSRKRLSGRPSVERLGSSKQTSAEVNPSLHSLISNSSTENLSDNAHAHENLLTQVRTWLKQEHQRRYARRAKRRAVKDISTNPQTTDSTPVDQKPAQRARTGSESSQESLVALDQLAHILEKTLSIKPAESKKRPHHTHRLSAGLRRHSAISNESDYFDSVDQLVPGCDAILDNSKTMAYSVDEPSNEPRTADAERRSHKERQAWTNFRYEILRLIHTLKLKGWRKVTLEQSDEIGVQRLSGALTNAVYVVSPPKIIPSQEDHGDGTPKPKNPPPKLLLRIYGLQADHLIDRESELQILTRLARNRIGPRLLGTFKNGRFEEFLNAKPLTAKELRNSETSVQIAKRMRELHEGIDLLKHEREAGPFVWQNWDKWVDRCEQVVTWLDEQVRENKQKASHSASDKWKQRGFVCGAEWPVFRKTIEKYRRWLEEQYGGLDKINERMVFSHNDTQYGNILRMMPEGESPLLLPANQHKQLVVIDFEYANANLPGLEFANHFTEWTYNYHDTEASWRCNEKYYPTLEEQHRFIRAYLLHAPSYKAAGGYTSNPATPYLGPLPSSGSTTALAATATPTSISAFMLDSRAPPSDRYQEQEATAEHQVNEEVRRLLAETKLWRLANSAMWVAWGIVQAQIPGMPDFEAQTPTKADSATLLNSAARTTEQVPNSLAETEDTVSEKTAASKQSNTAGGGGEMTSPHAIHTATTTTTAAAPTDTTTTATIPSSSSLTTAEHDANLFKNQDDEEFDYLRYANDRALFLWGDALRMGIVAPEALSEELKARLKSVED